MLRIQNMSAEPGRKAPYSVDLRHRMIWQKIGMALTFRRVAKNLNVATGTVYNVFHRFVQTGDVDPTKPDRTCSRKLSSSEELILVGLILDNPSLYLGEICQKIADITGIQLSPSTVCKVLHKHGLTRKKIQQVALQRSAITRAKFMADMQFFNTSQIVWLDETGCDRQDHIRKYGYSLRGERPVYHRYLHRGTRVSAITAMCTDGILATEAFRGTLNGRKFIDFLRGSLIPEMLPFDGSSARSVLVLDNCSVHHVGSALELLRQAGILVIFLPPYSSDLNPVEELFSAVKYYLKDHDEILQAMSDPRPLIISAFEYVSVEQCLAWISHSGVYY